MCDETHQCKEHTCGSKFNNRDDLIKYKNWLKHELDIVDKTLQDLEEETD